MKSEWAVSDNNRRARFYTITAAGRRRLERRRGALGAADRCSHPRPEARLTCRDCADSSTSGAATTLDAEFDDELRFHFDDARRGQSPRGHDAAARGARSPASPGRIVRAKEGMREARVMTGVKPIARDLVYGARLFRAPTRRDRCWRCSRSRSASAPMRSIYSLLYAVLLRPLPFPDADRLVAVVDNFRADGQTNVPPTVPELLDLRAVSRQLEAISFYDMRDVQINGGTEPARAFAARVEAGLFRHARRAGRDRAAVRRRTIARRPRARRDPDRRLLAPELWRGSGGGRAAIVVNGVPHTVVGVLPAGFAFEYLAGGADRAVRAVSDGSRLYVANWRVRQRPARDGHGAAEAGRHD